MLNFGQNSLTGPCRSEHTHTPTVLPKLLAPDLQPSKLPDCGEKFTYGPLLEKYPLEEIYIRTCGIGQNEISFPIISFQFVQEIIEKANFSDSLLIVLCILVYLKQLKLLTF